LSHFLRTVDAIKNISGCRRVEILVPDFSGQKELWRQLCLSSADVISHNVETIPFLYSKVRQGADYDRSLGFLKTVKCANPAMVTKSGMMLGLGESAEEVLQVLRDLRAVNCDMITLGQYLAPSLKHYPVQKYLTLEEFDFFKDKAVELGFKGVKSSPYVRSSYLAEYPG
jgi:lipoic acid synthetase